MNAPLLVDVTDVAPFDTETTGLSFTQDRIVTAYVGLMGLDGEVTYESNYLINPGKEISEEALKINGLDPEQILEEGSDPKWAINDIAEKLDTAFIAQLPIAVCNARFDFTMLDAELRRYDLLVFERDQFGYVLDVFVLDKWMDKYRKGKRRLLDLAAHYEVEHGDPHDSAEGAKTTGRVALAMLEKIAAKHPKMNLADLQAIQTKQAELQAESLEKYFLSSGTLITSPIYREWPLVPHKKYKEDQ